MRLEKKKNVLVRRKNLLPAPQMGSLRNNEILRCSSFFVTRIGMAGSLALLEVVS